MHVVELHLLWQSGGYAGGETAVISTDGRRGGWVSIGHLFPLRKNLRIRGIDAAAALLIDCLCYFISIWRCAVSVPGRTASPLLSTPSCAPIGCVYLSGAFSRPTSTISNILNAVVWRHFIDSYRELFVRRVQHSQLQSARLQLKGKQCLAQGHNRSVVWSQSVPRLLLCVWRAAVVARRLI